jgi:hypothetical protein
MNLLETTERKMVGESRFGRQVPLKGAQYDETSSPEVQPEGMDFTAGPAASLPRRRAKSRSLFVATRPSCSSAIGRLKINGRGEQI